MLKPKQQYLLTSNFDREETAGGFAHGHDPFLTHHNGVDFYRIPKGPVIPVQPQVHILGRGPISEGHCGFPPGFEVQGINHEEFHLPPHIPAEERESGASGFYQCTSVSLSMICLLHASAVSWPFALPRAQM